MTDSRQEGVLDRHRYLPLVLTVLWALWLTLEYGIFGPLSYVRVHDTANTYIPMVLSVSRSLGSFLGALQSGWLCGMDRLSTYGWWTSMYVPFMFLPAWLAHAFITFLQRFVAAYFTYRLIRDVLGQSRAVALAGGLAYSIAHTSLGEVCMMHQLNELGLPLLLWFFASLDLRRIGVALAYSAVLGVALGWAMSPLIGTLFLVPAAWLFVIVLRWSEGGWRTRLWITFCIALFGLVSLLRQIPELWALAANASDSFRGQGQMVGRPDWLAFVVERLRYVSRWWLYLLPALGWIWTYRRNDPVDRAIAGMLFLGLVVGPAMRPIRAHLAPWIGFARGIDFTRFQMVAALAMTMAGVRAIARLPNWRVTVQSPGARRKMNYPASSVVSAAVVVLCLGWSIHLKDDHWIAQRTLGYNWHALYGNADIAQLVLKSRSKLERMATVGADRDLHPGYLLAYGADTADGHSPIYSRRYYDFWTAVIHPLLARDPEVNGFHLWGLYVYLHHARSGPGYTVSSVPFSDWYDLDLLSLAGVRYFVSSKPVDDARLEPVPTPIYQGRLETWATLSPWDKVLAYLGGENPGRRVFIYRNPEALERFFLSPTLKVYAGVPELTAALREASVGELRDAVMMEVGDAPIFEPEAAGILGDLRVTHASRERFALDVDAPGARILVATQQFFPWWVWRVNGEIVQAFPAYGAFTACVVPAGRHEVTLSYEPSYGRLPRALGIWAGYEL